MLNIKQLNLIIELLTNKKNKISNDISKLNKEINYKKDLISKINHYQNECNNLGSIKHSQIIPLFVINRSMFSNRIQQLVDNELNEIMHLNSRLGKAIDAYKVADNHLSVFNQFKDNIISCKNEKEMRQEMIKIEENINLVKAKEEYDRL